MAKPIFAVGAAAVAVIATTFISPPASAQTFGDFVPRMAPVQFGSTGLDQRPRFASAFVHVPSSEWDAFADYIGMPPPAAPAVPTTSDHVYDALMLRLATEASAWGGNHAVYGLPHQGVSQLLFLPLAVPENWVVTNVCAERRDVSMSLGPREICTAVYMRPLIEPPTRPPHS